MNDTQALLEDLMAGTIPMDNNMEDDNENIELPTNLADIEKIMKLLDENEKELYEGCSEFTRLSFIVRLLHFQSVSSLSNVHFDMLLNLLRMVIPNGRESIPKSHYEATKLVKALGLDYEKIHACPNDCMLYYKKMKICNVVLSVVFRDGDGKSTQQLLLHLVICSLIKFQQKCFVIFR